MKRKTESTALVMAPAIMLGQTPAGDDLLLRALMQRLPPPGSVWPESERRPWLDALRQSFELIYLQE
jgi:hypothetical protein